MRIKPNSLNDDNNSNHNANCESDAYLENIIIVFTYNDIGYNNKNDNDNFLFQMTHHTFHKCILMQS